jgi:hypothetical protein
MCAFVSVFARNFLNVHFDVRFVALIRSLFDDFFLSFEARREVCRLNCSMRASASLHCTLSCIAFSHIEGAEVLAPLADVFGISDGYSNGARRGVPLRWNLAIRPLVIGRAFPGSMRSIRLHTQRRMPISQESGMARTVFAMQGAASVRARTWDPLLTNGSRDSMGARKESRSGWFELADALKVDLAICEMRPRNYRLVI